MVNMNIDRTVFSQIMEFAPSLQFRQCVERYNGNYKVITKGKKYILL